MCGIFGIVNPENEEISPERFAKMGSALKRRGPDHTGAYQEPSLAIGNTRLSIIDLQSGNQPIFNETGSLVIVYNGEIYNHHDLRKTLESKGHSFKTATDTEAVLHAFEEYGEDCLGHFNGMFAFAIWDMRKRSLFIARDRLGIKPLYITRTGNSFAFASEAKALLHLLPNGAKPDWTAIHRFFSFGYVPSPASPFEEIKKFPPGHFAHIKGSQWNMKRYFSPRYGCGEMADLAQVEQKTSELLEKAVGLELMSDVPLGIFLSGGLDSSAVAAFAKKTSKRQLFSFSARFEETTHDESNDARLVASWLKLDHHELLLTPDGLRESFFKVANLLDEPFGDATVVPLLALSEFARKYVKVALTGWGGDEIFAGYPTYRAHKLAHFYRKLPRFLLERAIPSLINRLPVSSKYMSFEFKARRFIKGTDAPPELQHFMWMEYFNDLSKKKLFAPGILEQVQGETWGPVLEMLPDMTEKDLVSRAMRLDSHFFLEGNGLFQVDRMTMAASLEARVPLLNNDLADYVNALPINIKMRHGETKGLLKKVLKPFLPESILKKPKKGFAPPSSNWLRTVFRDIFESAFSPEKVRSRGIFNSSEIQRLWKEHQEYKADHGRSLWALLSFQLWYDKFILNLDIK